MVVQGGGGRRYSGELTPEISHKWALSGACTLPLSQWPRHPSAVAIMPPPPPRSPQLAQISATTKRGCRPWAGSPWVPGNRGADLLLPLPPPPNRNGAGLKAGPAAPPPPQPPPACPRTHTARRHMVIEVPPLAETGRMPNEEYVGSGTRMVTQQVVLLSQTSEHHEPMNGQVDSSTTLPPPPPPACAPDGRGARSRRPQGLKSGGCEGLTA